MTSYFSDLKSMSHWNPKLEENLILEKNEKNEKILKIKKKIKNHVINDKNIINKVSSLV